MPEVDDLIDAITTRLRAVVAALEGLDSTDLNTMPTVEGTNSPYVLAAHTLGNARAWILGIALEHDIDRDRPGEFASADTSTANLKEQLAEIEAGMKHGFAGKTSADLDRRLSPRQDLWGPNPVREISVRQALLQVVHHASLHLGHLELTRDIINKR